MSDNTVTLKFVHPTNPSETMTAAVAVSGTPRYLIEQLVANGFMPAADSVGRYKLRTTDGTELLDELPIGEQGLTDGAQISIDHAVSGARPNWR